MFEITVNKKELIDKIKANRAEHATVFEAALEGYKTFVLEQLEKRIERLRKGKTIEENLRYLVPQDHTDEYDRVIDMLEMHLEDDITLDIGLYAQYVDNDWDWARNFAASNSSYTVLSGTSYGKFVK